MSGPMMGHRSKAASALQRRISNNLRRILLTEQEILLSTSSGTGLMEGAVRSCTAKRAAIFSVGAFGDKWYKIATGNGVPSDIFKSELGQPTTPEMVDAALSTGKYDTICITHNETSTGIQNPVEEIAEVLKKYPDVVWCMDAVSSAAGSRIETDKLGVDVLVTSTQKALALPPGMAVCTLSQKAYERTASVPNRGCYFDLRSIYDTIQKKDYQYTNTPCVSIMYAMDLQLQRIMQEGVENRFARHEAMAEFVRSWADEYFSVFANRDHLSRTLTVICRKTNAAKLKFPKQGKKRRVQFTFSIKQRPIHIGRNKFDGIHNAARIIVYPYFQGKSGFRQHGADSERKDQEASSKDTVLSIILRENLHFFHKFQLPSFYRECSSGKCK